MDLKVIYNEKKKKNQQQKTNSSKNLFPKIQWFYTLVIILHSDSKIVKDQTEQNKNTPPAVNW